MTKERYKIPETIKSSKETLNDLSISELSQELRDIDRSTPNTLISPKGEIRFLESSHYRLLNSTEK